MTGIMDRIIYALSHGFIKETHPSVNRPHKSLNKHEFSLENTIGLRPQTFSWKDMLMIDALIRISKQFE